MLGPNKWRLLTIVAGILFAHAIDSPNRSSHRLNQEQQQNEQTLNHFDQQRRHLVWRRSTSNNRNIFTPSQQIGLTIAEFRPDNVRVARNLLRPENAFSKIDNIRYIERRHESSASDVNAWRPAFGSFRYAQPVEASSTLVTNLRRRSDTDVDAITTELIEFTNSSMANAEDAVTTSRPTTLQAIQRRKYRYIPLGGGETSTDASGTSTLTSSTDRKDDNVDYTTQADQNDAQSRTDLNVFTVGAIDSMSDESNLQPQALPLQQQAPASSKIAFPDQPHAEALKAATTAETVADGNIQGRRSGIAFASQSPKFGTQFVPQSYREDDPSHPNFQVPYSEELSSGDATEIRTARGVIYDGNNYAPRTTVQFPGPSSASTQVKPFRDDVTKFGDVNGPVTSVQRQFSDFLENQGLRTYENVYYSDDYRRPRQYYQSPPKTPFYDYSEYSSQPLRSRLIVPYKSARSPRVIFPANDNFPNSNGFTDDSFNSDTVAFRWANRFVMNTFGE